MGSTEGLSQLIVETLVDLWLLEDYGIAAAVEHQVTQLAQHRIE
jgi:hypothetical protein